MVNQIAVIGAGRSSLHCVQYLFENQDSFGYNLVVADADITNLIHLQSVMSPNLKILRLNVLDDVERADLVKKSNVVISLLPSKFHALVAQDCILFNRHLVTPSYISNELRSMEQEIKDKGLLFLSELGLDPGIDHLSAMKLIHQIKSEGGKINSFKSWCGGLISQQDFDNPWKYKITWNPHNVVHTGEDGAIFKDKGVIRLIPYHKLFKESIKVLGAGTVTQNFDGYFNRNSLTYIPIYGLEDAMTFIRGTLRYSGFCKNWHILVDSGMTNDKIILETEVNSSEEFFRLFNLEDNHSERMQYLKETKIDFTKFRHQTPSYLLEQILLDKWKLNEHDRDRVVMIHEIEYEKDGQNKKMTSILDLEGVNSSDTAMSTTVGLPLAIGAIGILTNKYPQIGLHLPIHEEMYNHILPELSKNGITFQEVDSNL